MAPVRLPLELPRFHVKLSFLLRELFDVGVCGSSRAGAGGGDFGTGLSMFGSLGPAGFWWALSSNAFPVSVA